MINNTVLVGRLTRDPELRKTQSGTSVVSFTLAVERRFKHQGQEDTDFVQCVAWNHSADFMAKYLDKGALVGIEGRIQTRNYDDKAGNKVYVTEVVCSAVQHLESKVETEKRRQGSQQGQYDNQQYEEVEEEFRNPTLDISSDDLPF